MRRSFLYTFFVVSVLSVFFLRETVGIAASGVPTVISYQGRLTDQNGVLLGGTGTPYHFKFSIWDSATVGSGTKLWPATAPTATTLTVTDGVFDVNIGETSAGYPDALTYDFESNDTVYLQVEVSANGVSYETLGPRPRITSSSTAINAKTLGGFPSSYYLDASNLLNFDTRTLTAPLTGFTSGAGVITASDSILSAIQKLNGNIAGASGAVSSVFGRTGAVVAQSGDYTTDQVTEGSNLYYTQTRFDTAFGLKTTTNLTEGSNLYYTDTRFDTRFATKTTDNLSEGTNNLYFTDARARAAISVAGTPLSYNSTTGVFSIGEASSSTDGYLSSSDWNIFNGKQNAITTGTSSQYLRGDLTLASFPTALSAFTDDIGYLTGNQTITLSGDISGSGATTISTSIGVGVVTNAMLAGSIESSKLIGTDIATVGTITTGVWNGSQIDDTYIASASNWNAKESALTFSTGLTRTGNIITNNLSTGISGGQSVIGGTGSGESLTLSSTTNATKGSIIFGSSSYNESTDTLGVGISAALLHKVRIADTVLAGSGSLAGSALYMTQTWNTTGNPASIFLDVTNIASGGTAKLIDLRVGGVSQFSVGRFGNIIGVSATVGASGYTATLSSSGSGTTLFNSSNSMSGAAISVANYFVFNASNTFAPSAGASLYRAVNITPTINQSGTATGITHGIYIAPTLTAAADFRALETTQGKVVLADTYAAGSGSLAGSLLGMSQTWNTTGNVTAIKLNVTNTASGVLSYLMQLQLGGNTLFSVDKSGVATVASTLTASIFNAASSNNATSSTYNVMNVTRLYNPSSGTAVFNQYAYNGTINQTGTASGTIRGFYFNPTITSVLGSLRAFESTQGSTVLADTTIAGSGSLAGSLLDMSQTWNTTGNVSSIKLNVTNTASGTSSKLIDLQVGSANIFSVLATNASILVGNGSNNVGFGAATSSTGAGAANGTALRFYSQVAASTGYDFWFSPVSSRTATAGTSGGVVLGGTYAPTSGTGAYNAMTIGYTINQTGTATGITRGLYIGPSLTSAVDHRAIELASGDYGNGAAGLSIWVGRNTNATNTGAGSVNFLNKSGTNGYVWQDAAGNLRINTAAPTNANDVAGTVIGAQTSTRDTKQDITEYSDYADALSKIVSAPLHTFRYIREVEGYGSDSPLAKAHLGFIADEVDPIFMSGNVIDQVSVNGLLMGSIKALDIKIQALPILSDQSLTAKIAEFLRGIAESGVALVEKIQTKQVQTQELCVGDDTDQVCITKDQLRNLLGQQGNMSSAQIPTLPASSNEPTDSSQENSIDSTSETSGGTPAENLTVQSVVLDQGSIQNSSDLPASSTESAASSPVGDATTLLP